MNTAIIPVEPLTLGEPVGVQLARSGLTFGRAVSIDDWVAFGKKLKTMEGSIQWWIGDWLNYGEKAYGEKYREALDILNYEEKSLRNIASAAHRIEMSRRRDNLSWSHHAEVVSCDPETQNKWLDWAEKQKASVKELRQAVHARQPLQKSPDLLELRDWVLSACPHIRAVVQGSIYGVQARKAADPDAFDLELHSLTKEQVKSVCTALDAQSTTDDDPTPNPQTAKRAL